MRKSSGTPLSLKSSHILRLKYLIYDEGISALLVNKTNVGGLLLIWVIYLILTPRGGACIFRASVSQRFRAAVGARAFHESCTLSTARIRRLTPSPSRAERATTGTSAMEGSSAASCSRARCSYSSRGTSRASLLLAATTSPRFSLCARASSFSSCVTKRPSSASTITTQTWAKFRLRMASLAGVHERQAPPAPGPLHGDGVAGQPRLGPCKNTVAARTSIDQCAFPNIWPPNNSDPDWAQFFLLFLSRFFSLLI
eukprot:CAMPEP_0206413034 /NCGR_PEP_ID=MMETSP0294-20121207/34408_1 /ASSEMBLY_ACC=CAM_ASM_000327 /TAXON_ID=39354 /ORGANISM="Heterosigma akashiwo, Strain CCMP2393" /LENGTH=254 /DNA_ID=CAMNT_0053874415 /DNA_START=93 /DNA_END=857 /DNA_ORIENTATION=-